MVTEFQYVLERPPPTKVCFGTTKHRSTDPLGKDLSPFQKMTASETYPEIGPGHYGTEKLNNAMDKLTKKVRSVKGVGPLASNDPRFKEKIYMRTPSPTRYDVKFYQKKETSKAPFGSTTKRMVLKDNKLPGPGTYIIAHKKCRRTRFMYNFGHPTMISPIEIICVSRPTHVCLKCNQICAGDYWQKEHTSFLCHLCWEEEKRCNETFNEKELNTFQKIRNCSFVHKHEGTTAALRLLSPRKVKKKLRLENYLDLYIKC